MKLMTRDLKGHLSLSGRLFFILLPLGMDHANLPTIG